MLIFRCLKRMIEKGNYESKNDMAIKIEVLCDSGQLTEDQKDELLKMLEEA